MDTNTHNNTEYHAPQQPHRGTEMWGRLESGRALTLAATEPQLIWQLRDRVTDGGHSPVRNRRLGLIWLSVLYHTPQQPHRGKEMWGRLESGRALTLAVTKPYVIRQLRDRVTDGGCSPVRSRGLGLIWLPMPQETTPPTATQAPLRMDKSPPPPGQVPTRAGIKTIKASGTRSNASGGMWLWAQRWAPAVDCIHHALVGPVDGYCVLASA